MKVKTLHQIAVASVLYQLMNQSSVWKQGKEAVSVVLSKQSLAKLEILLASRLLYYQFETSTIT